MPGVRPNVGFGRAPAVVTPASETASRARASSSFGLKYSAASDRVCRVQAAGGQAPPDLPNRLDSNASSPGSASVRDSNAAADCSGDSGAGR